MYGPTDLLGIRRRFIETTGRYDLVSDPPTTEDEGCADDSGADWFINVAQRLLDQMQDVPGSRGSRLHDIAIGGYQVTFDNCRSVENVWVHTADGKTQLTYKRPEAMRVDYGDPIADIDQDEPTYWTDLTHIAPDQVTKALSDFAYDFGDILTGPQQTSGILVMPPSDGAYTLDIHGLWYSPILKGNQSRSWWTTNRPDVLILAAAGVVEMHYRNLQGVTDYFHPLTGSVSMLMRGLDKDLAQKRESRVGRRIVG